MTKYVNPHLTRYVISITRAFFSGVLSSFAILIPILGGNFDKNALIVLFIGLLCAGIDGAFKYAIEKRQGRV